MPVYYLLRNQYPFVQTLLRLLDILRLLIEDASVSQSYHSLQLWLEFELMHSGFEAAQASGDERHVCISIEGGLDAVLVGCMEVGFCEGEKDSYMVGCGGGDVGAGGCRCCLPLLLLILMLLKVLARGSCVWYSDFEVHLEVVEMACR